MTLNSFFFWISACFAAVTMTLNLPAVDALTGKVVSCPGWTLNKHKELRYFLKGDKTVGIEVGEINIYAGIDIEWKRGKRAVLTIFDDEGKFIEDVKLYELETRAEMHKLLSDKGFLEKTQSQIAGEIQETRREKQLKVLNQPPIYDTLTAIHYVVFVVIAVGFVVHGRKRRKKNHGVSPVTRL